MGEEVLTRAPDTQLFRDVFNASPIGIAVEAFDGQPLFVNPAFCSFLGFSEQELRHKHCVDFSPPEDAEKDWALFQQLREGSIDHYQLEKRYFRRDGSLVWGRLNISLLSSRPSPLVIAMVEDITDKKASLDREHDLLETLNFVTKQMAAAVSRCSHDLRYLWINQAYADWLQRPPDEIVGRPMSEVLGRAAFDALLPYFHRVLDGETVQYEQETNFHGIGKRWTSATYTPTLAADGTANGWVAVVLDITKRKLTENALLEVNRTLEVQAARLQSREELLKIFVKNVPAGVAMFDRDMHYLQVSDRWCADYSVDSSQVLGRTQYDVFPDIPERWREMHRRGLEGETLRADEDRWDREDGTTTWVHWEIRPWKTDSGVVGGILIFAEDITQRKEMENALSEVSRKLIQSQEQERARIGRELHDDINQRLGMLAIELQLLQDNPSEIHKRVQALRQQTAEISDDVQALSHELHSSKLEYLGVVAGIRSWCKEFGEHQEMEINFKTDVAAPIPLETGLTFFRILQEGLHNVVKHSGVKRVDVLLSEQLNEIRLTITDAGKGFDIEAARQGRGLGLASMEERVRLMNGTVSIVSRPMGGTSIHVRIPCKSERNAERAAG